MNVVASLVTIQRPVVAVCLTALLLWTPRAALASEDDGPQEALTRGALLNGEREAKAKLIAPPERSFTEKKLYWYDNQYVVAKLLAGWKGIHLAGGDFPAGAGLKFGVGFTGLAIGSAYADADLPNRVDLHALAASSTRGYVRVGADFALRNLGGAPFDVVLRGQFYELPQEDFFGLGPESREANRTNYLLDALEFGTEAQWKPAKQLRVGAGVSFVSPRIGVGTDNRFLSTERVFDPAGLPGLRAQSDFVRSDASVSFDWRDNPLHPRLGGFYGARVSDFRDQDLEAFDFRRFEVDLQQYVPLPHKYRALALRAAAVITDTAGGNQVPFFYQPTLGGSQTLRGFREFRFRDRNSLSLTAEYRWEAWWAMDPAVFVDAGKVAFDRRDLDLNDLEVSYGIGFRVHSNRAFIARLDLAFSREGFVPLLRFEHVF